MNAVTLLEEPSAIAVERRRNPQLREVIDSLRVNVAWACQLLSDRSAGPGDMADTLRVELDSSFLQLIRAVRQPAS